MKRCCGEGHSKFVGISLEGRQHNSLECKAQPGYQIPSDSEFAIFAVNCSFDSEIAKLFHIASLSPERLCWKWEKKKKVFCKKGEKNKKKGRAATLFILTLV